MFLAQITFGSDGGKSRRREELKDAAEWYLACLLKNGQIYGDYLLAWSRGRLLAYVYVGRPDSLAARYHSKWGKSDLHRVVQLFGQPPKCDILEDDVPKRFAPWKRSGSFYLYTNALAAASPLCCGDTGSPIPLYLLPLTQETREQLYFWARAYNHHDNIWLGSAALEIPAYKQLADPKSDLSVTGRKLCAKVERATGKPTFYYLARFWGRVIGEDERPCPLCGGKWHPSRSPDDERPFFPYERPFFPFHFRCKKCRLVSNCADVCDDQRHARIGEFKRAKTRPTRVGLPSLGSASAILETWMGASLEMMPPSCCAVWR